MEDEVYDEVAKNVGIGQAAEQSSLLANQSRQIQYQMEEQEKNLADTQLDCNETLVKIYHLLRQDIKKVDNDGNLNWVSIADEKKRVLTDEGVDRIMQIMESYINKETLLSNFDDKMIQRRMLKFSLSLSALMFLKYEIYFRTPSLSECEDILKERIKNKLNLKRISYEIAGKTFNEKIESDKFLKEIEGRIEYELQKIKEERIKLNIREFEMIFTQLEALVESTHNRAWKGEERGSLRRHFNISEVIGGKSQQQEKRKWGLF